MPDTFTHVMWPRFSAEGLTFWHIAVGTELGRRLVMHLCHFQRKNRAVHWAPKQERRQDRLVGTTWVARLRRVRCNGRRYWHLGLNEMLMTQRGECALQVTLYDNIPMADAEGKQEALLHVETRRSGIPALRYSPHWHLRWRNVFAAVESVDHEWAHYRSAWKLCPSKNPS